MLATGEEAWKLFAEIVTLGARGKELYALIPRAAQADDLHGLLERVGVVTMQGLLNWEHAEKNEADQCEAIRQSLTDIHSLRSDVDRASAQLEQTRQRVRREILADMPAKQYPLIRGREVYLIDGEEKEWGPDDGSGMDVYIEDGRVVKRTWSQDVRVPLRPCDYETPIITRLYPFRADSPEEDLTFALAAHLLTYVPFWRRFKLWPICKVNGVRGYRAIHAAYAETRRMLLDYGYSEKDFEPAPLPDIVELLEEGNVRRESADLRTEPDPGQSQTDEIETPNVSNKRFAVALSFPGERRDFVERLRRAWPDRLGRSESSMTSTMRRSSPSRIWMFIFPISTEQSLN
jgi:hypothetical protein